MFISDGFLHTTQGKAKKKAKFQLSSIDGIFENGNKTLRIALRGRPGFFVINETDDERLAEEIGKYI